MVAHHSIDDRQTERRLARYRLFLLAALCLGFLAADDPPASNSGDSPTTAFLVPIPLPLTGDADQRVITKIDQLLTKVPAGGVLICEFRPQPSAAHRGDSAGVQRIGKGTQFERALALARYLASPKLGRLRTVAYLPHSVEGHAVLPVLACEKIIVHPDAELGAAGVDESFIDPTIRRAYEDLAERRRTIPTPVVLGMLDRGQGVVRVETSEGVQYLTASELEKVQENTTVRAVETIVREGDLAVLRGSDLRVKHGFASHLAADRVQLAAALKIPTRLVEEDPSLGDQWRAVRIELNGRVNSRNVHQIRQGLEDLRASAKYNLVFLIIDSPGGSPESSVELATYLAGLDSSEIRTVACIAGVALGDAVLPALACDHLVMWDQAVLGGPGEHYLRRREQNDLLVPVRNIAQQKSRNWSLLMGLVSSDQTLHRYVRKGTGESRLLTADEFAEQEHREQWERAEELDLSKGLRGERAIELGIARSVVRNFDEVRALYGLADEPQRVEPSKVVMAIERLAAEPWFARTLLFIAFFALMTETSTPGVGAAGFISAVCFLLFFWTQFLNGTADWLNVLLFIGGLGCLMFELFVTPGFGVFGIGGLAMIVASILLASQTFIIPRNSYQFEQFAGSLLTLAVGGGGAVAALVAMRRFLPNAPILKRLMLNPPAPEEAEELAHREAVADYLYLEGKRGVTTTPLTPGGKARFGDEVVSVISDGELIPAGTPVYVAEALGNHVLVRTLEG